MFDKKLEFAMLCLLLSFLFIPIVSSVGVNVDSLEIKKGEQGIVNIFIDSDVELYGGQMDVSFNDSILKFIKIEKGDFFDSLDGKKSIDSNDLVKVDVKRGKINKYFIMKALGEEKGSFGKGVFAKIFFEGKKIGKSEIKISNVEWADKNAKKIANDFINNGYISVNNTALTFFNINNYLFLLGILVIIILFVLIYIVFKKRFFK